MGDRRGEQLIDDLLVDPHKFDDDGRAYDLLQEYFAGLPRETLRPLLKSSDVFIQRSAAFIVSELGSQARDLVDAVVLLLRSTDRHVLYYALESLTVCCDGEHAEKFAHVARALESDDHVLRALAMRLVSNADVSQIQAARRFFEHPDSSHRTHAEACLILAMGDQVQPAAVKAMIQDPVPLVRRYGAIVAKRLVRRFPDLLTEVWSSDDPDLRRFYGGVVNGGTA